MTATETEVGYTGPVNFDLIDKHIAWAEAEEAKGAKGRWDQNVFGMTKPSCGTAFCLAGHVAFEAGYKPGDLTKTTSERYLAPGRTFAWLEDWDNVLRPGVTRAQVNEVRQGAWDGWVDAETHPNLLVDTWVVGAELFGIDGLEFYDQGHAMPALFAGSNSLVNLKQIRDEYARMEGYPTKYEEENAS